MRDLKATEMVSEDVLNINDEFATSITKKKPGFEGSKTDE